MTAVLPHRSPCCNAPARILARQAVDGRTIERTCPCGRRYRITFTAAYILGGLPILRARWTEHAKETAR